jgi:tRNA U34 2-thiouridine synthase MnmA/TrmU
MKVLPTQNGDAVTAQPADTQVDDASTASFKSVLASATPETDVKLHKGEKIQHVEGHAYAEVTAGDREGMYINTSGNVRNGQAFVLVRKHGKEYHIYGTGKDRLVVGFHMPDSSSSETAGTGGTTTKPSTSSAGDIKLRKGEKIEPVEGHGYAEIVSGPRSGMYINTSGNSRHGEAFVLVHKDDFDYHIYGSGADRVVVRAAKRDDDK